MAMQQEKMQLYSRQISVFIIYAVLLLRMFRYFTKKRQKKNTEMAIKSFFMTKQYITISIFTMMSL